MNRMKNGIKFNDNYNEVKDKSDWIIRSLTEKVQRKLDALETETPARYKDMITHLSTTPHLPMKKIAFMMKHIDAFEYRFPNYKRVYYKIIGDLRLVVIYSAGEHPDHPSAPTQHQSILIEEITDEVKKIRQEENQGDQHTSGPVHHKHQRHK